MALITKVLSDLAEPVRHQREVAEQLFAPTGQVVPHEHLRAVHGTGVVGRHDDVDHASPLTHSRCPRTGARRGTGIGT